MIEPLVTIVVPIYNSEKYLNRCLDSIVAQTYKNLEIVLVDDGSSDTSPKICDEWQARDARIHVIHKQNAGAGMARNTGIDNAAGEYIFIFDSDDYIAPNTVEKCISVAHMTSADTVLFGRNDVYTDGRIVEIANRVTKPIYEADEIINTLLPGLYTYRLGYGVSAWSKMFSMRIIKEHQLRFLSEREVVSEDSFFCLDYFPKAAKVALVEDRFYYYFKNDMSISRTYKLGQQIKNNNFLIKGLEKVKENNLPDSVGINFTSRYHIFCLAAMKHIVVANMPWCDRKAELRKIYNDKVFRGTIKANVLRITPFKMSVFLILLKFKFYFACDCLLKYKMK